MPSDTDSRERILCEKYEILKSLGAGKFAFVKKGRDIITGEIVALKVSDRLRMSERQYERLLKEITAMRTLSSPFIIRLCFADANTSYPNRDGSWSPVSVLAMEYAPCGELFSFLMHGAFSQQVARKYFLQLLSAVRHCHENGIYHRDIKPENILLASDFSLRLADFGLCAISTNHPSQDTHNDSMSSFELYQTHNDDDNDCKSNSNSSLLYSDCGTSSYMSPEAISHIPYSGPSADCWSMVVVLFIMITGNPPLRVAKNSDWWYKQLADGKFGRFWEVHARGMSNHIIVSDVARDFINRSLSANHPDSVMNMSNNECFGRLTLDQMVNHEFLSSSSSSSSNNNNMSNGELIVYMNQRHEPMLLSAKTDTNSNSPTKLTDPTQAIVTTDSPRSARPDGSTPIVKVDPFSRSTCRSSRGGSIDGFGDSKTDDNVDVAIGDDYEVLVSTLHMDIIRKSLRQMDISVIETEDDVGVTILTCESIPSSQINSSDLEPAEVNMNDLHTWDRVVFSILLSEAVGKFSVLRQSGSVLVLASLLKKLIKAIKKDVNRQSWKTKSTKNESCLDVDSI